MNRRDIIRSLRNHTGAEFITRAGLSRFMGIKDPHGVDKFLAGLQRVNNKYYYIPDVADALMGERSTNES